MKLSVDNALKEIDIVSGEEEITVKIAVYDVFFLGRIMEAGDKYDKLNSELLEQTPEASADYKAFIEYYHKSQEIDRQMRDVIDALFNAPVCDTLFPEQQQSMFAIGGGAPTWANILAAIIDGMDSGLDAEKQKAQARIRKYSAKYKK